MIKITQDSPNSVVIWREAPTIDELPFAEELVEVDGFGVPFDEDAQKRHLQYILDRLNSPSEEIVREPFVQPEWKDKPAGQYTKGSGV